MPTHGALMSRGVLWPGGTPAYTSVRKNTSLKREEKQWQEVEKQQVGYIAKFFPQDWFADSIGLTDEQFGVYMRMVFCYWSPDGLPFNPADIAEMIGSNNINTIVASPTGFEPVLSP